MASRTPARYNPRTPAASGSMWKAVKRTAKVALGAAGIAHANYAARTEGPASAITQQNDSRTLYRRRRAPKRVRRRARAAYKRFLTNQLKAIAMNNQTFNLTDSHTNPVNSRDTVFAIVGALQSPQSSLESIGSIYELAQNSLATFPDTTNFKLYLHGMRADYTYVNSSDSTTMELDIYKWVQRKDLEFSNNLLHNYESWANTELAEQGKLPGASNQQTASNITYTPFQNGALMRNIIILSKQRFYIAPGQAISFVDRHVFKKPKMITGDIFSSPANLHHYLPGLTRGILASWRGLPSATNPDGDSATLRESHQATYRFKVLEESKEKNAAGY